MKTGTPPTADRVADEIHAAVYSGEFMVGEWLRQEVLAERFDTSRGSVREALRRLQDENIVELFANRGARVLGPTVRDTADAFILRAELEGLAAERAATNITPALLRELRTDIEIWEEELPRLRAMAPRDLERGFANSPWHTADVHFHRVILRASGLAHVDEVVRGLRRFWPCHLAWGLYEQAGRPERSLDEHRQILAALDRRDGEAARSIMAAHLDSNRREITEWMQLRYRQLGIARP